MTVSDRTASLTRELASDERVMWVGTPRARAEMLHPGNWLFAILWLLGSAAWLLLVNALASGPRSLDGLSRMEPDSLLPAVGLIGLLAGVMMLTRPIRVALRAGRTCYAITDRRLLRVVHGGRLRVLSVPLRRIDSVVASRTTPGWGTVRLSATTIQDGRPLGSGAFLLRGVSDVAQAYALLADGVAIRFAL